MMYHPGLGVVGAGWRFLALRPADFQASVAVCVYALVATMTEEQQEMFFSLPESIPKIYLRT